MKSTLQKAVILLVLMAFSAMGQEFRSATKLPEPPDKQKVSYALGMRMGQQIMSGGHPDVDANKIAQAVKDVLEGKPAQIQESEISLLFKQAQDYIAAKSALTQEANIAPDHKPEKKLPEPPDKGKFSYAMGMRMGQQLKRADADVDADTITEGINDVLGGKPTQIQESEIPSLFRQAQAYAAAKQGEKNKAEGKAFLVENAKVEGIATLPNGEQYRVLQAGAGEIPKTNDLIVLKYRGTLINGKEFDHNDHFVTHTISGIKGWQEALQRMKVGSKWQVFVPSDLAYGAEGMQMRQIGPNATLIYELELLAIIPPGGQIDARYATGRLGHGLGDGFSKPGVIGNEQATGIQDGQTNTGAK